MTHFKKSLSVVLALLMLISVFAVAPITASAEVSGDYWYKILEDGTARITAYKCSAKNLEIPWNIAGYTVTSIGSWAFDDCTSLTSVTIPSSVTSIGEGAFEYCTNLTNITIPSSVTSIGRSAFYYCTSLTSIDVDSNNKNYSSIYGNLYNKDQSTLIQYAIGKTYTSFTIPSSVTSIGRYAFSGYKSLTSVTIPSSVTSIGDGAFSSCTSLTSVTIPDSVTSMGHSAFINCTSLTSVTIPGSVTNIGEHMFFNCTSLTSVTIPSSVTDIGDYAFGYYYDKNYDEHKIDGFKITGYSDTEAERYANDNGFEFISLGEAPTAVKKLKTPKVTVKPAKKAIKVTYKKVKDAKGFKVTYKIGKKTYNEKFTLSKKELKKAKVTKKIKVKKSGKYKVTVKAFVTSGKKIAYSKPTSAKTVKVK